MWSNKKRAHNLCFLSCFIHHVFVLPEQIQVRQIYQLTSVPEYKNAVYLLNTAYLLLKLGVKLFVLNCLSSKSNIKQRRHEKKHPHTKEKPLGGAEYSFTAWHIMKNPNDNIIVHKNINRNMVCLLDFHELQLIMRIIWFSVCKEHISNTWPGTGKWLEITWNVKYFYVAVSSPASDKWQ